MRKFMSHHINGDRKAVEKLTITIAVDHLLAVPKSVIVIILIVDSGVEAQAIIIYGVAAVDILIQIICPAAAIVRFVDRYISHGWIAFFTNRNSGQAGTILGVVENALLTSSC